MNTAKIRELAEQMEKEVLNKQGLVELAEQSESEWLRHETDFSVGDIFSNKLAQRFQIIAQAAGGIKEICDIEEAKIHQQLEEMK